MQLSELMQSLRAFQESRALLTAVELDLFTAVGVGATPAEAARKLGTDPRATEMLMNALAALGVLIKREGVFDNAPIARRYLAAGSPEDARAGLMHTVHLWQRWSTLTDCVRAGTAVSYEEIEDRGEKWIEAFIAAMHWNAVDRAPQVVKAVGASGIDRMLDIGGGSGAYSIAFAKANPRLKAEVLDLEPVLAIAQGHIDEAGVSDRVTTRSGDLRRDRFGEDYNLILLSAICHMLGPEENADLFRRCFDALAPGGRIVIQDFILEPDKTASRAAALFALNMLVATRAGSSYSEPEYADWLGQAGFRNIRRIRLLEPTGLMIGERE